jgi:hypothetical protein
MAHHRRVDEHIQRFGREHHQSRQRQPGDAPEVTHARMVPRA